MKINEFSALLRKRLSGLPNEDIEKTLDYYNEIINDRIEDGMNEEEAVKAVGTVDEIVSEVLADISLTRLIKEKITPKRTMGALWIILLIIGSPLWLSIVIAIAAVVISVYAVLWVVVAVLYVLSLSFAVATAAGVALGLYFIFTKNNIQGVLSLGICLIFAGLSILMFFMAGLAAKGAVCIGKKLWLGIKKCFLKKENKG